MLLYLTSNQKSSLIDAAVRNMTLPAKKLVGRFSLKSFVTKDMRNYANAKFFVVDAACIEESGNDFTLALQSFQMMFSARIIVILSGCEDVNGEVQRLLSIGVVNLVMVNVSSLLHELAEQGKTLLVTTHDYEFLMHTCTHICYLLNGRVESFFPVEPRYTPQIYSILFQKEVVL